jgi:hypothetical protein
MDDVSKAAIFDRQRGQSEYGGIAERSSVTDGVDLTRGWPGDIQLVVYLLVLYSSSCICQLLYMKTIAYAKEW